ncbi:MAG TPA: hypothetical protein PKG81_03660, partial [Candidatus Omnitrophota bacterium]|nr:hypothetical protein [Candidatus Omnitrophota bacterium]
IGERRENKNNRAFLETRSMTHDILQRARPNAERAESASSGGLGTPSDISSSVAGDFERPREKEHKLLRH